MTHVYADLSDIPIKLKTFKFLLLKFFKTRLYNMSKPVQLKHGATLNGVKIVLLTMPCSWYVTAGVQFVLKKKFLSQFLPSIVTKLYDSM